MVVVTVVPPSVALELGMALLSKVSSISTCSLYQVKRGGGSPPVVVQVALTVSPSLNGPSELVIFLPNLSVMTGLLGGTVSKACSHEFVFQFPFFTRQIDWCFGASFASLFLTSFKLNIRGTYEGEASYTTCCWGMIWLKLLWKKKLVFFHFPGKPSFPLYLTGGGVRTFCLIWLWRGEISGLSLSSAGKLICGQALLSFQRPLSVALFCVAFSLNWTFLHFGKKKDAKELRQSNTARAQNL